LTVSNQDIPYIPGGENSYSMMDTSRDNMILKFITKLQTPRFADAPPQSRDLLLKAIVVAKNLEKEIFNFSA